MNPKHRPFKLKPNEFEQIKQLVLDKLVVEELIPKIMMIGKFVSSATAYKWMENAARAVKYDLKLEDFYEK